MLKAFRVMMKIDILKVDDEKAAGGTVQDVLVYEKDFGKSIADVVAETIAAMDKINGV